MKLTFLLSVRNVLIPKPTINKPFPPGLIIRLLRVLKKPLGERLRGGVGDSKEEKSIEAVTTRRNVNLYIQNVSSTKLTLVNHRRPKKGKRKNSPTAGAS